MQGSDDAGITRSISMCPDKGFDGRLCDDFVVVLPHPCLFACDVRAPKHVEKQGVVIGVGGGPERFQFGRRPGRFKFQLRNTVMKEFDG